MKPDDTPCQGRKSAQVIKIAPHDIKRLDSWALALKQGALLALPTETLYGLAGDHKHFPALERLAALKGRQAEKPFPLILSDRGEAEILAQNISGAVHDLMQRFWPGPLTLILTARPGLHPRLVSSDGGVAVRVSSHPLAAGLAKTLGRAITATSANLAGQPPVARARDLDPALLGGLDYILDAGPCPGGPPSTVLDVRERPWRIIRQGAVALGLGLLLD